MAAAVMRPATGAKRVVGIRQLLEWTFAVEHAGIDTDPFAQIGGEVKPGVGTEYILMERQRLGGIRIDGGGRSWPHDDAEIVAAVVEALPVALGGLSMAIDIARLARARMVPDCMAGARPRLVPRAWRQCKQGLRAQSEVCETIIYSHRGRRVVREVRCCPVTWEPSAARIAAARRGYLEWWGALQHIAAELVAVDLRAHVLSAEMPGMAPWRKGA